MISPRETVQKAYPDSKCVAAILASNGPLLKVVVCGPDSAILGYSLNEAGAWRDAASRLSPANDNQ